MVTWMLHSGDLSLRSVCKLWSLVSWQISIRRDDHFFGPENQEDQLPRAETKCRHWASMSVLHRSLPQSLIVFPIHNSSPLTLHCRLSVCVAPSPHPPQPHTPCSCQLSWGHFHLPTPLWPQGITGYHSRQSCSLLHTSEYI